MSASTSLPATSVLIGAAIAVGAVLGVSATFVWRWYRARSERLRRKRRIEAVSVEHVRDVAVPDGSGGMLHIDYLLLTPRGLLVLDLRDVAGNVFGSDPMIEWTVMQGARRLTFANPQGAMYDRIAALKLLVGDLPIEGRIVFSSAAAFPKGLPRMTVGEESLEAEFPLGERAQADQIVAVWQESWQRLRGVLEPSEFGARR